MQSYLNRMMHAQGHNWRVQLHCGIAIIGSQRHRCKKQATGKMMCWLLFRIEEDINIKKS